MALGKISFDIYGQIEDRWSAYSSSKYRDAAIEEAKEFLGSGQFAYLVDLCTTEFGIEHQAYIIEKFQKIIEGLSVITDLVDEVADRRGVIRGAATVRDRMLSTNLPEEWRLRFA